MTVTLTEYAVICCALAFVFTCIQALSKGGDDKPTAMSGFLICLFSAGFTIGIIVLIWNYLVG